jgi:hypothetical protein
MRLSFATLLFILHWRAYEFGISWERPAMGLHKQPKLRNGIGSHKQYFMGSSFQDEKRELCSSFAYK